MPLFRIKSVSGDTLFSRKCGSLRECIAAAKTEGVALRGADFARADLTYCDFRRMSLQSAYFARANMRYAWFTGAHMDFATMCHTDAAFARFRSATMPGVRAYDAVFTDADFRNADLRHSHLDRACFTGAQLLGTQFTAATTHNAELVAHCKNRTLHQFTEQQYGHYRDNLYALLCAIPELARPLLAAVADAIHAVRPPTEFEKPWILFNTLCPREQGYWDELVYSMEARFMFVQTWFVQFGERTVVTDTLLRLTHEWLFSWCTTFDTPAHRELAALRSAQPSTARIPAARKLRLT